ncbi:MAG: hypothetical protein Q8M92_01185 [Candidatus Subteraquimicrobiales bacterium]|nr:hypothetical protein [Candidatus Subteraquimicrobiales bacterium]
MTPNDPKRSETYKLNPELVLNQLLALPQAEQFDGEEIEEILLEIEDGEYEVEFEEEECIYLIETKQGYKFVIQ